MRCELQADHRRVTRPAIGSEKISEASILGVDLAPDVYQFLADEHFQVQHLHIRCKYRSVRI